GYGDDGNIWGSEFMVCDLESYERYSHFEYIPLPGGDKVTHEPWRVGVSYLYNVFGKDFINMDLKFIDNIEKKNIALMLDAIDKKINSPLSSGAGRLFDGIAAIINLCPVSSYHAEAPMRLESIIDHKCTDIYNFETGRPVPLKSLIEQIVMDIGKKSLPVISAKFHNTIIAIICEMAKEMRSLYKIEKIVLSGGSFQNRYILSKTETELLKQNFEVFIPSLIPVNDGGIALGQLAVAAKRRQKGTL
ncbi:MAG: carbamoyltransferase HypF, partial [Candidatus Riflemargulisbacteria bacterium]